MRLPVRFGRGLDSRESRNHESPHVVSYICHTLPIAIELGVGRIRTLSSLCTFESNRSGTRKVLALAVCGFFVGSLAHFETGFAIQ